MKSVNFKQLNIVMVFLLLITILALFTACKDKGGGGAATCQANYVLVNNVCQYQGYSNGTLPYSTIPSMHFAINGRISNGSAFRDLINSTVQTSWSQCSPSEPCRRIQVSLRKISETEYLGYFRSPAVPTTDFLFPAFIPVVLTKVESPSNPGGFIFEGYQYNPQRHVAIQLWTAGSFEDYSMEYFLNFEGVRTASGTMKKGIDY